MLFKVQKLFDDGTTSDELDYSEKAYIVNPKQQNIKYCHVTMFRYQYEGHLSPSLVIISGKKYIVPTWQEVHLQTTLDDIIWIKPQPKKLDTIKLNIMLIIIQTLKNGDVHVLVQEEQKEVFVNILNQN